MNEYFNSKQLISFPQSEEDENLKKEVDWIEVKCRISLKNIQCINENEHVTGTKGVGIDYHDGTGQFIVDNFEKVCKLHDQYLKTKQHEKIQLN